MKICLQLSWFLFLSASLSAQQTGYIDFEAGYVAPAGSNFIRKDKFHGADAGIYWHFFQQGNLTAGMGGYGNYLFTKLRTDTVAVYSIGPVIRAEYLFNDGGKWTLTPALGAGFLKWHITSRAISGTQENNFSGWLMKAGLKIEYSVSSRTSFLILLNYQLTLTEKKEGIQTSYYSPAIQYFSPAAGLRIKIIRMKIIPESEYRGE